MLLAALARCDSRTTDARRLAELYRSASAAIFSCGQPLGVEERKTEGEREEGGAEAIAPEEANESKRRGQEMGVASFR